MNVFDWLSGMEDPGRRFDTLEVRFKGGRKDFYRNPAGLDLTTGDAVVVEMPSGHHVGHVSLQGDLVRLQMKKKGVKTSDELKGVHRLATEKDLERHQQARQREAPTLFRARQIIGELKLHMKLSDVEFQADNTKAIFYYSADERVDFRELIKMLASEFRIRVEMKQISLRQEAGRLGGIGSCGRELCCSTWLSDFRSVSTAAARYQNLSLNPGKLSGQCGRLKCCLNYELDTYVEALRDIPTVDAPLLTEKGVMFLQKTDIFRKMMWFGSKDDSNWYPVPVARVNEILALNRKGIKPASLETDQVVIDLPATKQTLNTDLALMDKKFKDKVDNRPRNNSQKKRRPGGPPRRD